MIKPIIKLLMPKINQRLDLIKSDFLNHLFGKSKMNTAGISSTTKRLICLKEQRDQKKLRQIKVQFYEQRAKDRQPVRQ